MKKNTKFTVLILALVMLCLCLTGCDELDQMRNEHAFWTTKGSIDSITYNGSEYKRIDVNNMPNPLYNSEYSKTVCVTDPDVPVLLSETFGDYFNISEDGQFITGWYYDESMYENMYYEGEDVLYCKADKYDNIMAKINAGIEYTKYGYGYYIWDEEKSTDIWTYNYLTDEETKAVNEVLNNVKPENNDDAVYDGNYVLTIDRVSDDNYFGNVACELYVDSASYYLVQYSQALDLHTVYKVPQNLEPVFEKMEETASRTFEKESAHSVDIEI